MMNQRSPVMILMVAVLSATSCRQTHRGYGPGGNSSGSPTTANSTASRSSVVKSKIDVCNLLTSDDLKSLQGEAYQEAQRSDRLDGDFVVAQCYYAMPTTVNSVVVNVTTAREEAGAPNPKTFWEQTVGRDEDKERKGKGDREREREQAQPKERERGEAGEEKESSPPQRVKDLGDEAFWVGSPVGGALYVLEKDLFFRVSIGGPGDQKSKLNKSRTLAEKILKKLS